jgi:hypothetical protein
LCRKFGCDVSGNFRGFQLGHSFIGLLSDLIKTNHLKKMRTTSCGSTIGWGGPFCCRPRPVCRKWPLGLISSAPSLSHSAHLCGQRATKNGENFGGFFASTQRIRDMTKRNKKKIGENTKDSWSADWTSSSPSEPLNFHIFVLESGVCHSFLGVMHRLLGPAIV